MRIRLFLVVFSLLQLGCSTPPRGRGTSPETDPARRSATLREDSFDGQIRIGLLTDEAELRVQALAEFRALDLGGRPLTATLPAGPLRVRRDAGSIVLSRGSTVLLRGPGRGIELASLEEGAAWGAKDNVYPGRLRVLLRDNGLSLINVLHVEEYLRGVVPWEIGRPDEDAVEAVKAQAIAARTYAYAHLAHWDELGFDLWDSVTDQVYRGWTGTALITDRAVRETSSQVISFEGQLIRAYYSSTDGGHSSTLTDVWTREGAPYLIGIRDVDSRGISWCARSRHFRWTESWSARQLGDILRQTLPAELQLDLDPRQIGVLDRLEVVRRDRSGRVQLLRVHTDRSAFDVWGDRIRWVLTPPKGPFSILRSTLFTLEHVRREGRLVAVIARGGGFGHGVGMCQTGALARARAGQNARQILDAYYPGVRIGSIDDLELPRHPAR
jgi:stage II sporulation protein D